MASAADCSGPDSDAPQQPTDARSKPMAQSAGIQLLHQAGGHTIFQIGSGHYSFEVMPQTTSGQNP
jgi:hypothetical protein